MHVCMLIMNTMRYEGRVVREAQALGKVGHEVAVLAFAEQGLPIVEKEGPFTIHRFWLRTRRLPKSKGFLLARYLEYVPKATILSARAKADVYHAHDLPTLLPAYWAARLVGARIVYDAHELWPYLPGMAGKGWWRWLERTLIHKADRVITANEGRACFLQEKYRLSRKPLAVHNYPLYKPMQRTALLHDYLGQQGISPRFIVLYQGVFQEDRYLDSLIASADSLPHDIVIVLIGYSLQPTYGEYLRDMARSRDNVVFHEAIPQAQLLNYTASADVGIVFYKRQGPNYDYCAPNKLYDYIMTGLPSIGNHLRCLEEFEKQGVAILVDPSTPSQIAEAILHLEEDPGLYTVMRRKALQLAREVYRWDRESSKLIATYAEL
jgi:glycosyltransferase involved in cell wall biosynthesis